MPGRFAEPSELAMPNVMSTNAYATLAGALDELARRGFTEGFQVVDGGLRALGHPVAAVELNSGLHGIVRTPQGLAGGADPRREGVALGE